MKQRSLTVLSIIFSLCLLIFACRKEISFIMHDRDLVSSELLESAKIWYLKHVETNVARKANAFSQALPQWKEAWTTGNMDSGALLIVPASKLYVGNNEYQVRRFFVFRTHENNIEDGRILAFWGEKYNVAFHQDFLLENYTENYIEDFDGYVLQYDVNFNMICGTAYKKGNKLPNRQVGFIALPNGCKPQQAQLRTYGDECIPVYPTYVGGPPEGLSPDCYTVWRIDYTYNPTTGCLYLLVYTYMYAICPGDGSGSGGGSGSGSGSDGTNNTSVSAEPSSFVAPSWWWNDTSIYYPPQPAPSWPNLYQNYPKAGNQDQDKPASAVYQMVGGQVYNLYLSDTIRFGNACALRVSYALNHSGIIIPNKPGYTFPGGDGKYYFLSAAKLYNFLSQTFGSSGSNVITLHESQGGPNGVNFHYYLEGHKGIYVMRPNSRSEFGASGHCTLFNSNDCLNSSGGGPGCYYNATGGINTIRLWIMDN